MKGIIAVCLISLALSFSCHQKGIKYELYSKGELVFEILPGNIEFYDTTQYRGYIEIHEMRLKEGFFKQDSFILKPPLELICRINGERYFWADFFQQAQSEPRLWVNFKFRSSCDNVWTFQEQESDRLVLRTRNECNSIELFHRKKRIEQRREAYYDKQEYFRSYVDTARLAHEILLDPYYLGGLKESGVTIK